MPGKSITITQQHHNSVRGAGKERCMKELHPVDIMIGNFVNCFGGTVIVTGITPRPDGSFFVHHSGDNQKDNPFGEGIEFRVYPIELTEDWKEALRIDNYNFPSWVKYVHEAQNFIRWYAGVDLLPNIDWKKIPTALPLIH